MTNNVNDILFTEWAASLKTRDRSSASVRPNFEELFEKLKNSGATFEEVYENILPKAIKAHLPASTVARRSYKYFKASIADFDKSEKEFVTEWHKSIEDTATEAFFEFYKIPNLEDDPEPKVFGNMSAKEYRAQRRYAEQFPVLDTSDLEKRWREQEYNLDVEDLLKNVLGDDNG